MYAVEEEYITKVSYALRTDRKSNSQYVRDQNGNKVVIPKGIKITVQEVKWNSADNFWGTVNWNGYTGYIWMGQVDRPSLKTAMDERYEIRKKIFTVNRKTCRKTRLPNHPDENDLCTNCLNEKVVASEWFKKLFGNVPENIFQSIITGAVYREN